MLNVRPPTELLGVALSPLAELVNANTRYVVFAFSVKLGVVTTGFVVPLALAASDAAGGVGVGVGVNVAVGCCCRRWFGRRCNCRCSRCCWFRA